VEAYKFLRAGAIGPFSGFAWPVPVGDGPGAWVAARPEAPPPFADAVRGCSAEQLAYWVHDELWRIELENGQVGVRTCAGPRARLLRRVEAWQEAAASAFVADCLARAASIAAESGTPRTIAYGAQAAKFGPRGPAYAGYQAAHVAGIAALERGASYDGANAQERRRQSEWIVERVGA
jgi:hypothetical protein